MEQGEELTVIGWKEVGCRRRALDAGRGAELAVRYPTTEGDPLAEYHRVLPDGMTEVYVDSTEDVNSDQKWGFAACDQPKSVLDVAC